MEPRPRREAIVTAYFDCCRTKDLSVFWAWDALAGDMIARAAGIAGKRPPESIPLNPLGGATVSHDAMARSCRSASLGLLSHDDEP